ncbi:hypothetical protein [Burkholderia multivorans]|uniref:hypothetical protein n=1 Tax=Burkholderia multivorans TaxID=87883 RepID=UPI0009E0D86A|nr:hypothetical protein [Burkholderia multivorans]SAK33189.1 hypothetical protein UA11_01846 [Burkholderia multivorans]
MNQLYAIVEKGVITNVIVWDGNMDVETGGWTPPDGATAVPIQAQPQIGWTANQASDGTWMFSPPAQ